MLFDLSCAAAAGILARGPCHPLDTCKTVALSSTNGGGKLPAVVRTIYSREGIAGFYRGMVISSVGSAPGVALYLVSYEKFKTILADMGAPAPLTHLAGGFLAETVSCVVWVPIDVVKERLQVQGPDVRGRYSGSVDGLRTVLRNERLFGLYKGYFSTLASFGPFSAVYFVALEFFRTYIDPLGFSPFTSSLICGALGNTVASVVTNPFEVVKCRIQVQRAVLTVDGKHHVSEHHHYGYANFRDGLAKLVRTEGLHGMFRGIGARIAYTAPNAALTMAIYQQLRASLA